MSSESINIEDYDKYQWSKELNSEKYIFADYIINSRQTPEITAFSVAKEQSSVTLRLPALNRTFDLANYTARIVSVEELQQSPVEILPYYSLILEPDKASKQQIYVLKLRLAFPLTIFSHSIASLLNVIVGEIARLGFISAIQLINVELPTDYIKRFKGPKFGSKALGKFLDVHNRPIFCRSFRPAVGLTIDEILEINHEVLMGGFDAIKDDELTVDVSLEVFKNRIKKMVQSKKRIEDVTGERKMIFVNIIDDSVSSIEKAKIAQEVGVDGVIVAPALQGLDICRLVNQHSDLFILAHNSFSAMFTRSLSHSISNEVYTYLMRLSGSDLIMLPGNFCTPYISQTETMAIVNACSKKAGKIKTAMPIICGNKKAEDINDYVRDIGHPNFMMIVASAVDNSETLRIGASKFREYSINK